MVVQAEGEGKLFEAAHRVDAEQRAEAVVSQAWARLVLKPGAASAFFASLLFRLEREPAWWLSTAATDGQKIYYNPDFVLTLEPKQLVGLLVHEVCHVILLHQARRKNRDMARWNVVCDLSLNPLVLESGFELPPGALIPGQGPEPYTSLPPGKSAEEYYSLLPDCDGNNGPGQPGDDPGGCGGVLDAGKSAAECESSEREWQAAVAQAAQAAKSRGDLPGSLARHVGEVLSPKADWREVLRRFITAPARSDFSWSRPNRRHVHAGIYLPSLAGESLGTVAVSVDVSGSICQKTLDLFAGEVQGIVEAYDCSLRVAYSDTRICREDSWEPGDGPFRLHSVGGGGTDHACVFRWLDNLVERPSCLVLLTDLYTAGIPAVEPDVPCLWAVVNNPNPQPPWGELIKVTP